jgi:hypothetical protein
LNRITGATPSGGVLPAGVLGPPAAVVARLFAASHLRGAKLFQLGRLHVAVVREPALHQLAQLVAIAVHPLHLVDRTLVVVEAEPGHRIENRLHRLRRRARDVGVLRCAG